MQKTNNLQEIFLTQARRDRRSVTMFLMNGFQMRGYVTGFDAFTVVLTSDGKQQIVYKHAISTIVPERPIPLYEPGEAERGVGSIPVRIFYLDHPVWIRSPPPLLPRKSDRPEQQ